MADGVTVANAFVQVMPSMEGATSNISNALVPSLGSAGDKAGAQFGSVFAGKAGTLLKAAGGALAGVFAVGAMKDAFATVEAGFNNVKLATGATGDQAEKLKSVYLDVSKSVSGSFEDIGSAVGELNTRFGLQGEELESASEAAMKYAKVTGQDATTAIQDVSRMMNNAGISADQYSRVLDMLTVAGQASGVDVGKLTNIVNDNAASFKQLGFSTEESIAMLASFEKAGVNSSAVLSGMKKGVAEWTEEGKSAKEGFQEFIDGVQNGSVTSADAIELFGSKAGIAMFDAAQKGQLSFDEMYQAITADSDGALDSVYQSTLTAQEKFDILGKNLQAGFFEILEPIVDALMPYVDSAISGVTSIIDGAVEAIMPFIDAFSAQISPILDQVLPELQSVFADVMSSVGSIVEEIWPYISQVIGDAMGFISGVMQDVWPMVKDIIHSVMKAIEKVVKDVWPSVKNIIKSAIDVLKPLIEAAWPAIQSVIETAMNAVKGVVETVWPYVQDVIEGATSAIDTAIHALEPIAEFVTNLFNGIKDAMEDPIGAAKDFIDGALGTIQDIFNGLDFSLPEIALPHFDIWGGEFPYGIGGMGSAPEFSIDWYAQGGFADDATLRGYGEKGLELYWPGYSPYFEKYAKGIAEHMPAGAGGVDIHDCTFNVRSESDIRRVAQELNTLINRQQAGAFA